MGFFDFLRYFAPRRNPLVHDVNFYLTVQYPPRRHPVVRRPPARPIHFPVEIVFSILEAAYLDHNFEQNNALLKSCALVCQDWSTPAQKLLFRHVMLKSQPGCVAFSRAVDRSTARGRMLGDAVVRLKAILDHNQPDGLSHQSFARAVALCPRLYELDLSLYGSGVPSQDVIGSPSESRMQRIAPSFDEDTLSILKSGPTISALQFNNWSDNQQSLLQLLDTWPTLKSLIVSGTPPAVPVSTSIHPPSCVLEELRVLQSCPSVEFLKWMLYHSTRSLRILDFAREPPLDVLNHLLVDSGFPLQSLFIPTCSTKTIPRCPNLKELMTESPRASSTLHRDLPKGIQHVALGVDKNTALQPILNLIKSRAELTTLSMHIWNGGEHHPQLAAVKIACARRGIELRLTDDICVFRTMTRGDPVSTPTFPRTKSFSVNLYS